MTSPCSSTLLFEIPQSPTTKLEFHNREGSLVARLYQEGSSLKERQLDVLTDSSDWSLDKLNHAAKRELNQFLCEHNLELDEERLQVLHPEEREIEKIDFQTSTEQIKLSFQNIILSLFSPTQHTPSSLYVDELVQATTEEIPASEELVDDENKQFITASFNESIKYFQPASDEPHGPYLDRVLTEMLITGLNWAAAIEEKEQDDLGMRVLSVIKKIHPIVVNHLRTYGVNGLFRAKNFPKEVIREMRAFRQAKLDEFNRTHGTDFENDYDSAIFFIKNKFRSFASERLALKNNPNFVRETLELMGRLNFLDTFAECVCDDIQADLTPTNSPVLQLLDQFIIDFIKYRQDSIWFHDGESNFGYKRSEADWVHLLVSDSEESIDQAQPTILNEIIKMYLGHFEFLIDIFQEAPLLFEGELETFAKNLIWLLTIPLDSCMKLSRSNLSRVENGVPFFLNTFQFGFLKWAFDEVSLECPDIAPKYSDEDLKIFLNAYIFLIKLPEDIRKVWISKNAEPEKNEWIDKIQTSLSKGIKAARYGCQNLFNSRNADPTQSKVDLTMGFGFTGFSFNKTTEPNKSKPEIFLNLSEKGRSFPDHEKNYPNTFFSMPFLYAIGYNHPSTKSLFSITILNHPTDKDKKVHKYLLKQILVHYFRNDEIEVNASFYNAVKEEITKGLKEIQTFKKVSNLKKEINRLGTELKSKKNSKEVQETKKNDLEAKRKECNQIMAQAKNLHDKFEKSTARFLISHEEFQILLESLENKASICVESVITRHSKNSLIIPLSFNLNRPDKVTVNGKPITLGPHNRPVIPPCDNYCQLFSGSHILWAELTRRRTMNQLDLLDKAKGGKGVRRLWEYVLGATDSAVEDEDLLAGTSSAIEQTDQHMMPPRFMGQSITGTINQYSRVKLDGTPWPENASRATCTVNALAFLSRALYEDSLQVWEGANNPIDLIIEQGREEFEEILCMIKESLGATEKENMAPLKQLSEGGINIYDIRNIEEKFFLEILSHTKTELLQKDNPNSPATSSFFETKIKDKFDELREAQFKTLGVIFQCNGSTYAMSIHFTTDVREICIFDSHGCSTLNTHDKAFIYITHDIKDASSFLGNLIQFFDGEHPNISNEDLNQLGITFFKTTH